MNFEKLKKITCKNRFFLTALLISAALLWSTVLTGAVTVRAEEADSQETEASTGAGETEGEVSEDSAEAEETTVVSQPVTKEYDTEYITDDTGEGSWYLVNHSEGTRFKLTEIDHLLNETDYLSEQTEEIQSRYQILVMGLGVLALVLLAVIAFLAIRLKDQEDYVHVLEEKERMRLRKRPRRRVSEDEESGEPQRQPRKVRKAAAAPTGETADPSRKSRNPVETARTKQNTGHMTGRISAEEDIPEEE